MKHSEILPYYYPTTVCFIDDNASYLESLTLHIPESWPHRIFHSGASALAHINRPDKPPTLADRCFAPLHSKSDSQLALDLGRIEREITRPNRFEDVSVLLVDYAMPNMNGLEMCAKVTDPNTRIVLLTGVADEAVAVQAFNAGLIHQYIRKGVVELQQSTFTLIENLRRDYIANCTVSLFAGLRALPTSFRQDAAFQAYFERTLHANSITEFYLVTEPSGYLLIDAFGQFMRMIVLRDHELAAQELMLTQYGAPAELLKQITARESLGYFYEHPADYGDEAFPWHDMIVPAQAVHSDASDETWYVGIHQQPPIDIDYDLSQSSLDYYLNHLDPNTGEFTAQSRRAARREQALQLAKQDLGEDGE